jgi:hypothetical protein
MAMAIPAALAAYKLYQDSQAASSQHDADQAAFAGRKISPGQGAKDRELPTASHAANNAGDAEPACPVRPAQNVLSQMYGGHAGGPPGEPRCARDDHRAGRAPGPMLQGRLRRLYPWQRSGYGPGGMGTAMAGAGRRGTPDGTGSRGAPNALSSLLSGEQGRVGGEMPCRCSSDRHAPPPDQEGTDAQGNTGQRDANGNVIYADVGWTLRRCLRLLRQPAVG